jgi:hypothetical protein
VGRITSHKVLHSASYGNNTLLAVEINGHKAPLALAMARRILPSERNATLLIEVLRWNVASG